MACEDCTPCPPCTTPLPETCEPLTQSASIQRIVGEDEEACKVTLINPVAGGILFLSGAGAISWKTGAVGSEINLPIKTASVWDSNIVTDSSGNLTKVKPTPTAAEYWLPVFSSTEFSWKDVKDIYGAGSGILRKDINSPFGASWITGTAGQIPVVQSSGNVQFVNPSIAVPTNAYPDRVGIVAYKSAAKVMIVNYSNIIVGNGSGSYLEVVNSASKTLTLSSSGVANGLDTGALGNSTHYYLFVIYNQTSGVDATLASLSPTAPTLPSGYTYFRRIGMFRTDSSGNIPDGFSQNNNLVRFGYDGDISIYTKTGGATSGFASGTVSDYISTDYAFEAMFRLGQKGPAANGELNIFIAEAAGSNLAADTECYGGGSVTSSQSNKNYASTFFAFMPIGTTSYYNIFYSGMSNASDAISLRLAGYRINI